MSSSTELLRLLGSGARVEGGLGRGVSGSPMASSTRFLGAAQRGPIGRDRQPSARDDREWGKGSPDRRRVGGLSVVADRARPRVCGRRS